MTQYKAAFFDIDGTLVGFKTHCVSEATRLAIAKLRRNGIRCFISSGRHIGNIDNLGDLEFDGYVTVNGGMTYYEGELVDSCPINKEDVGRMLEIVYPENKLAVSMVLKEGLVMNVENERTRAIFEQLEFKKMPVIEDLRKYRDADVYQMISFFTEEEEPEIMGKLANCQSARWSPVFTDVVPLGTSKVRGIRMLCERLGIGQEEVIAFGDGGNDVEMLRYAGLGVAMGNATETVKASSDMVCPSVEDEGIGWTVGRLNLPFE